MGLVEKISFNCHDNFVRGTYVLPWNALYDAFLTILIGTECVYGFLVAGGLAVGFVVSVWCL